VFVNRNKIAVLTKEEQEGMRKVCRLAREVLDIAAREAKPGVTTDYIDEVVHRACMERKVSELRSNKASDPLIMRSHTPRRSITATFPSRYVPQSTKSFATAFPTSEFSRTATS
jgi:hypothetical protein